MGRPRAGIHGFLALFAIGWVLCVFPLAAQESHKDFAAGIYAYQQKDFATAYKYLAPLAAKGHSSAQYNLGRMYANGQGVPRNLIEAYKWFFLSFKNGRKEGEQAMLSLAPLLKKEQISEAIERASNECCALKR
ncbi:MAG: sel1 repeat family protein [Alphaproteobacteria bacterium]|nr:sel1 repeat family protein [Alphaproteobacteria bacterium]